MKLEFLLMIASVFYIIFAHGKYKKFFLFARRERSLDDREKWKELEGKLNL